MVDDKTVSAAPEIQYLPGTNDTFQGCRSPPSGTAFLHAANWLSPAAVVGNGQTAYKPTNISDPPSISNEDAAQRAKERLQRDRG